jgi:hypothetical protein
MTLMDTRSLPHGLSTAHMFAAVVPIGAWHGGR